MEVDFLLASLLLVSLAALYLQFSEASLHSTAESKQVAALEVNALKASELLKRKCGWNARECAEILSKLNATVRFEDETPLPQAANNSSRVCVRRLFARGGDFKYAEVCAT